MDDGEENRIRLGISQRELLILRRLAANLPISEVASELQVSTNTVRAHLYSIYVKLGATSRTGVVKIAKDLKLL
jgi:LuxR family maltose regulon positive regulatory protein